MIAASIPDNERVLQVLLSKGADVNEKSEHTCACISLLLVLVLNKLFFSRFFWSCTLHGELTGCNRATPSMTNTGLLPSTRQHCTL